MNYQSDLLYPATLHARSMTRLFNRQLQFHGKFTPSVLAHITISYSKTIKIFPADANAAIIILIIVRPKRGNLSPKHC